MSVIDVITYNGERELFDIRHNILKDYVDEFIVVEFDKTFSGKPKERKFDFDLPKVKHYWVTEEQYSKYKELAESSPLTVGADHWKREFMQKESIKDCLTHLKDDDIVFIGDCDEIWKPACMYLGIYQGGMKLPLMVYTYYLNNRSSESFWGTYLGKYSDIKDSCLNNLRASTYNNFYPDFERDASNYCGWHFTSMGGFEALKNKLEDSYTKQTYAADEVINSLENNITNRKDFLGRAFTYTIDESHWPQYLKDNKEKYKHLCYD